MNHSHGKVTRSSAIFLAALLALSLPGFAAIRAAKEPPEQGPIPELKPPRGNVPPPKEARSWLPWLAVAACFAGAAVLVWPRPKAKPAVTETPYGRAARAIRENAALTPQTLGSVLRDYATHRFHVQGPALTFRELADSMKKEPGWTPELATRFRRLADPIEIATFAPEGSSVDMPALRDDALSLLGEFEGLRRPAVSSAV